MRLHLLNRPVVLLLALSLALSLAACQAGLPGGPPAPTPTPAGPVVYTLDDFKGDCVPTLSPEQPCPGNDILALEMQAHPGEGERPAYFAFKLTTTAPMEQVNQPDRDGCLAFNLDRDDTTGLTVGELYGIDRLYCFVYGSQAAVRYDYERSEGPPAELRDPPGFSVAAGTSSVVLTLEDERLLEQPFRVQAQVCSMLEMYSCDQTGTLSANGEAGADSD